MVCTPMEKLLEAMVAKKWRKENVWEVTYLRRLRITAISQPIAALRVTINPRPTNIDMRLLINKDTGML